VAAFGLCAFGQNAPVPGTPAKEPQIEAKGMPPRATPSDYQAQEQAGRMTIAAEFQGHSIITPQGPLSTEEFVVVETGFFGPLGTRLKLSFEDFSLRINGKKDVPSQPYGVLLGSVKDPEWVPPEEAKPKSKSALNLGGDEQDRGIQRGEKEPPFPVKIPIEVQRAMAERIRKASLPEGDRPLPVAGLIYFPYSGKTQKIHTIELVYSGPAGKTILTLEP